MTPTGIQVAIEDNNITMNFTVEGAPTPFPPVQSQCKLHCLLITEVTITEKMSGCSNIAILVILLINHERHKLNT